MTTKKPATKKKRPPGRPPKAPAAKRDHVVKTMFTADKLALVAARAEARGLPVSTSVALAAIEDAIRAGHTS